MSNEIPVNEQIRVQIQGDLRSYILSMREATTDADRTHWQRQINNALEMLAAMRDETQAKLVNQ